MADGGAWQSGVFDNSSGYQHGASHDKAQAAPGGGHSPVPGVPATMYNPPATIGGGKDAGYIPVVSISLRSACIVFTIIGFAITGTNEFLGVKAIDSSNMVYLLAADVIVCAYSIVQLVLSIVNICAGKPVLSGATTPASTITFTCDQAMTYMLMAACGAGACFAHEFKDINTYYTCTFCDKLAASVAISFLGFVCIAFSCALAYFRVHKLAR